MSTAGRPYYKPELDVLRFLAFSLVFVHHFMPPHLIEISRFASILHVGSEQGVQIFFVLSAFLITELLLREQAKTHTIHVASFYIRRILRIWPLYFLLIVSAAILTLFRPRIGFPLSALAYFSLLSGNWYVVQHGWVPSVVAPLWTISIEEQFYLIWPLTIRLFAKRGLIALIALFTLVSYGALIVLGRQSVAEHVVRANSFVEFQFFALGAALALLLHKRDFKPGVLGRFLLFATAVVATWITVAHFGILTGNGASAGNLLGGYFSLAVSTVCMFLLFLNANMPGWTKPLIYLGRITYGLYAFHFIAFSAGSRLTNIILPSQHRNVPAMVLHAVITLVLCLLMAAVSYNFVETPFLRLKKRFTFVKSRDAWLPSGT